MPGIDLSVNLCRSPCRAVHGAIPRGRNRAADFTRLLVSPRSGTITKRRQAPMKRFASFFDTLKMCRLKSAACALSALVSLVLISLTFLYRTEMYANYLAVPLGVNTNHGVDNLSDTPKRLRQARNTSTKIKSL